MSTRFNVTHKRFQEFILMIHVIQKVRRYGKYYQSRIFTQGNGSHRWHHLILTSTYMLVSRETSMRSSDDICRLRWTSRRRESESVSEWGKQSDTKMVFNTGCVARIRHTDWGSDKKCLWHLSQVTWRNEILMKGFSRDTRKRNLKSASPSFITGLSRFRT